MKLQFGRTYFHRNRYWGELIKVEKKCADDTIWATLRNGSSLHYFPIEELMTAEEYQSYCTKQHQEASKNRSIFVVIL